MSNVSASQRRIILPQIYIIFIQEQLLELLYTCKIYSTNNIETLSKIVWLNYYLVIYTHRDKTYK